jgi:GMP synthase-like glutamine amidotransferase
VRSVVVQHVLFEGPGLITPALFAVGSTVSVVHWHEDTFDLPEGAELLARSDLYAHQAFRVGTAYGLQFHVEIGFRERGRSRRTCRPTRRSPSPRSAWSSPWV